MHDSDIVSEEVELWDVLLRRLSRPLSSLSVASSDTLSTCPTPHPEGPGLDYHPGPGLLRELAEPLLGRVVGKHLHEWVELSMTLQERSRLGVSFYPWFREFWVPIVDLMLVSSTFHDIVSRLVRIAFGIQVPVVQEGVSNESLVHQVYTKLRSLFYFGSAVLSAAFQAPPATWDPFMKAYGNYIIALKHRPRGRSPGSDMSPIDITQVCQDLHADLHLCCGRDLPIFLVEDLVNGVGQILKEDKVSDWGAIHE